MRNLIILSIGIFWIAVMAIFGYAVNEKGLSMYANISNPFNDVAQDGSQSREETADLNPADENLGNGSEDFLSVQDVAKHNSVNDCWQIINGKVYDLTKYLPVHPGGAETMLPYCGRDATIAYQTKDKSPSKPHSGSAASLLQQYYIGTIGRKIVSNPQPSPSPNPSPVQNPTPSPNPAPAQPTPTPSPNPAPSPAPNGYTLSDVSAHNRSSDCWLIISKKVYNVTAYLPYHPGGQGTITPYCGRDATSVFAGHSNNAANLLKSYYIGELISSSNPSPAPQPAPIPAPPTPTPTPTPNPVSYTPSQVAVHNRSSDCWLIVSAKVYNVTAYLPYHPGGQGTITPYCGRDATSVFAGHSGNATGQLASYYIGELVSSSPSPVPQPTPAPQPTPTPAPQPRPQPREEDDD